MMLFVAAHESAFGTKRTSQRRHLCPLLGVKRTSPIKAVMSPNESKRREHGHNSSENLDGSALDLAQRCASLSRLTFIEFMDERNGHYETRPAENIAARSRNDATVAALRGASDQINLAEAVHCGYYYGCGYYLPYVYYRPYGYYRPYYRQYP